MYDIKQVTKPHLDVVGEHVLTFKVCPECGGKHTKDVLAREVVDKKVEMGIPQKTEVVHNYAVSAEPPFDFSELFKEPEQKSIFPILMQVGAFAFSGLTLIFVFILR